MSGVVSGLVLAAGTSSRLGAANETAAAVAGYDHARLGGAACGGLHSR